MKLITIIFIMLLTNTLTSIGLNIPSSALMNGCSNISLLNDQPSAFSSNPALLNPGIESTASYLYNISDLPFYGLHINIKYRNLGWSGNLSYLNHSLYKEISAITGLNLDLQYLRSGISIQYLHVNISGYSQKGVLLINGGISWDVGKLTQSFYWINITSSCIKKNILPVYFVGECCYNWDNAISLAIGLEKERDFDFSYRFGCKWQFFPFLGLTSGYQYQPERLSFGVMFKLIKCRLDYSVRTHKELDLTHYLSLSYELFKN